MKTAHSASFRAAAARPGPLGSIVAALALLGSCLPASAGFIDERKEAPISQQSADAVVAAHGHQGTGASRVLGGLLALPWRGAVDASATGIGLGTALIQMMPVGAPPILLDAARPDLLDRKVSYTAGESRLAILRRVSMQHGLVLNLDVATRKLIISEAVAAQPVTASTATGLAQTPVLATNSATPVMAPAMSHAVPVATPAPTPLRTFEVRTSEIRLAAVFERWAKENGVKIRWDADKHVLLGAPMTYQHKDVFDAVAEVLASPSIRLSDYPLEVCEYPNTPRLLRITRQGDQTRECGGGASVAALSSAPSN